MHWFHKNKCIRLFITYPNTDTAFQFAERKIKEFAAAHSYDCMCNYEDLHFCLEPNNLFSWDRNSFRPEINIFVDPNTDRQIGISLSLPRPVRIVIAAFFTLLVIFGVILACFSLTGNADMAGIAVWGAIFVFTAIFVCMGRLITFHRTFLNLQRLFSQEKAPQT